MDTFGTEPVFNYKKWKPEKDTGSHDYGRAWGNWELNPRQFMTMYRKLWHTLQELETAIIIPSLPPPPPFLPFSFSLSLSLSQPTLQTTLSWDLRWRSTTRLCLPCPPSTPRPAWCTGRSSTCGRAGRTTWLSSPSTLTCTRR